MGWKTPKHSLPWKGSRGRKLFSPSKSLCLAKYTLSPFSLLLVFTPTKQTLLVFDFCGKEVIYEFFSLLLPGCRVGSLYWLTWFPLSFFIITWLRFEHVLIVHSRDFRTHTSRWFRVRAYGCYLVNLAVPFEELCLIDKDGYLLGALRTYWHHHYAPRASNNYLIRKSYINCPTFTGHPCWVMLSISSMT